MEIGTQIKRAREMRNITQKELAEQVFCTRQLISFYETGRRVPGKKERERIEQILGIKLYSYRRAVMQLKTLTEIGSVAELENITDKIVEEMAKGYGRNFEKVLAHALFVAASFELLFPEGEAGWSGVGSGLYHFFLMTPLQPGQEFDSLLEELRNQFYEKMEDCIEFEQEICSAAVSKISDLVLVFPKSGSSFTDSFKVLILETSEVLETM